jgi:hypothetical protein
MTPLSADDLVAVSPAIDTAIRLVQQCAEQGMDRGPVVFNISGFTVTVTRSTK